MIKREMKDKEDEVKLLRWKICWIGLIVDNSLEEKISKCEDIATTTLQNEIQRVKLLKWRKWTDQQWAVGQH